MQKIAWLSCVGLSLERLLKIMTRHAPLHENTLHEGRCAQDLTSSLDHWCTIQEETTSWLSVLIIFLHFSLKLLHYICCIFLPSITLCVVQSTMDTTVGGACMQRTRMFKRGICLIVAPSPNHPRPNNSTSWEVVPCFCHMSPKNLNWTIQFHYVRIKYFEKNKKKSFLPPNFPL